MQLTREKKYQNINKHENSQVHSSDGIYYIFINEIQHQCSSNARVQGFLMENKK